MEKKTVFKWFWAWQDEAEEAWLRKMAQQGWHLAEVGIFGVYSFAAGEPRDSIYRLDFQSPPKKELSNYLQLFRDAGWEHIGSMASWQYFRKPVQDGEEAEIFTDAASKIAKYRRVIMFLLITGFPLLWMVGDRSTAWQGVRLSLDVALRAFGFIILVIYVFSFVNLARRIRQLRK